MLDKMTTTSASVRPSSNSMPVTHAQKPSGGHRRSRPGDAKKASYNDRGIDPLTNGAGEPTAPRQMAQGAGSHLTTATGPERRLSVRIALKKVGFEVVVV